MLSQDENGTELVAFCSAHEEGLVPCVDDNADGSTVDAAYSSRITIDARPESCDAHVSAASPWDTGTWTCHFTDQNGTAVTR